MHLSGRRKLGGPALAALAGLSLSGLGSAACSRSSSKPVPRESRVVANYNGGQVTQADVGRELAGLPPPLRERFEESDGRRDLTRALIGKRLLVVEARRRQLDRDPALRQLVSEYEERLLLDKVLADEEKTRGAPTAEEARHWYYMNKQSLATPERVRMSRLLVSGRADASRRKAESLHARLVHGEAWSHLVLLSNGPERAQDGDLGFIEPGTVKDPSVGQAVRGLRTTGEISKVVESQDGFAIFKLADRQMPRVPSFDEARAEIAKRMMPVWKRDVFNDLVARLRESAGVKISANGTL